MPAAIQATMICPYVVRDTPSLPFLSAQAWTVCMTHSGKGDRFLVAEVDGLVVGNLGLHGNANPRRPHAVSLDIAAHDPY